jgi:drug/metabolite transporter (DMT)-like permease
MIVLGQGLRHQISTWDALAIVGALLWPIGMLGFGGFGEGAGPEIITVGSVLVVVSLGAEFWLRDR